MLSLMLRLMSYANVVWLALSRMVIVSDNVENCVSFFQLTHMSRWYLVVLV